MDEKKSVVLYTEWAKPLSSLSLEDKGRIFDAILSYSETGESPHFDSATAEMAFSFIRLRLDENAKKWFDVRQKRREAGRRGALVTNGKERQSSANPANVDFAESVSANVGKERQSSANPAVNVNANVNANVNGNVSPNGDMNIGSETAGNPPPEPKSSGRKKFIPPSLDEVTAYCNERHNGISPSAFVDYYEARGWKYGTGKPMVNWKAAVRTWEQKEKDRTHTQGEQQRKATEEVNARIFEELFGGEPT